MPRAKRQKCKQHKDEDAGMKSSIKNDSKSTAKVRGRRSKTAGMLAPLLEMPVDILVEVAFHLHPLDVLHLARTYRNFNELLMSKSSKPIWNAAFADVGAPKCPPEVSEPRYAALLFERNCMACGRYTKAEPSYTLRLRICKKCPRSPLSCGTKILESIGKGIPALEPFSHHILFTMVPYYEAPYDFSKLNTTEEIRLRMVAQRTFYPQSLEDMANEYLKIRSENPGELGEFVKTHVKKVSKIEKHAKRVERWVLEQNVVKRMQEEDKSEQFKEAVYDNLQETGSMMDIIEKIESVEKQDLRKAWEKLVYQPKVLTPRIWNNLRPKLVALIYEYVNFLCEKARRLRVQNLRWLLQRKINSLGRKQNEPSASQVEPQHRALHVPIVDLDELSLEGECKAIKDFIRTHADRDKDRLDPCMGLPDEEWAKLVKKGIMKHINARRDFVEDVLNKLFLEGASRVDADPLDSQVRLPASLSLHHAAAFLRYDAQYLPANSIVLGGDGQLQYLDAVVPVAGEIITYSHAVTWFGLKKGAYALLRAGAEEWKQRVEEIGATADEGELVEKWRDWKRTRQCKWEGSAKALEVALVLLEALGYGGERGAWEFVGMSDMQAKGDVFVCLRCAEQDREKMEWVTLVEHFYDRSKAFGKYDEYGSATSNHDYKLLPPPGCSYARAGSSMAGPLAVEEKPSNEIATEADVQEDGSTQTTTVMEG